MWPQMCASFLWNGGGIIVLEQSSLIWVLQQCYTTAFKMHKSIYSCSFARDAWHVHWRRANFWDTFICSAPFVVKTLVCDDREVSSLADQFKGRWRMETVGSREKRLINLPSGRVRGHEAVIFICYTTSSSPPHQPGLVQSNAGAVICVLWF